MASLEKRYDGRYRIVFCWQGAFQTREQIERQLARGGLSAAEIKDLWSSLFLTLGQVKELLAYVRDRSGRPWVHVGFCP